MSILADALRILGRFFGLRPGPDVEKLPEPPKPVRAEPFYMADDVDVDLEKLRHKPTSKPS